MKTKNVVKSCECQYYQGASCAKCSPKTKTVGHTPGLSAWWIGGFRIMAFDYSDAFRQWQGLTGIRLPVSWGPVGLAAISKAEGAR